MTRARLVIDRTLLSYDGGHMTNAFARSIWRGLARLLPKLRPHEPDTPGGG